MGTIARLWMGVAIAGLTGIGFAIWQGIETPSFETPSLATPVTEELTTSHGWPQVNPLPSDRQVWHCDVVVVGGSLGGVAAAAHAMQAGAQTCLIELTPWLGGQISSQGVSAIDESLVMRRQQNFSGSWNRFKQILLNQTVALPESVTGRSSARVSDINGCWVGDLCFPPEAGHLAAQELLESAQQQAPDSRWLSSVAFKGAEFNTEGDRITAIYAVARTPRDPNYSPAGRLSQELHDWYGWDSDELFEKTAIELRASEGRDLVVIDATDTGEVVGWANIPHRLGSDSQAITGEPHAVADNPDCTQAFTFPFVLAIAPDDGNTLERLATLDTTYAKVEHRRDFSLSGFNLLSGRSVFNYRRIASMTSSDPMTGTPGLGDMTAINWNRGNDWNLMNPPLILTAEQVQASGQDRDWLGGLNTEALQQAEAHALLFAEWLMQNYSSPETPLTMLSGEDSPLQTTSGLSMYPYIREGRRILGRSAYGDDAFQLREQDIRLDMTGGREFADRSVATTNYAVDIHGCRYRNWEPSGEASSAPANEFAVRNIQIPLEALLPQDIDNLLIGGKGIAVTHIVNAATRTHYGEWSIGGAAGAIAAYHLQTDVTAPLASLTFADNTVRLRSLLIQQQLRVE
ncbi:MAG: FAD-dependent oxidoreductase [Synechococcus sp.]